MLIQNYYYKDSDQTPVIVGTHTITVPAAWCIWRDLLCSYPDKTAFLDVPTDDDERVFMLALPGETYRRIMFAVPLTELRKMGSVGILYDALLTVNPETILAAVEKHEAFELELKEPDLPEKTAVPVSSAELNGLQLIGNTRQALQTVAKMLPKNSPDEITKNFCLAVNPPCYNDLFTTVVSEEMPDGEWQKLKIEHTDYSSSMVFHDRRRTWIRKHQRPRILLQVMFFIVILLAMGVVCMHFLRRSQSLARENQELKEKNKRLEYELQRIRHSPVSDQKSNPDSKFQGSDSADAGSPAAQFGGSARESD